LRAFGAPDPKHPLEVLFTYKLSAPNIFYLRKALAWQLENCLSLLDLILV